MFTQITEHVYYRLHEPWSDRSTVGYIRGEKFSLLFEAGSSPFHAEVIRNELAQQGLMQPSLVAVSHWHWDHSFGLCAWDVPTIAGKMTNEQLRVQASYPWNDAAVRERIAQRIATNFCYEMMKREYNGINGIRVVPADIEFDEELTLDLGGVTCVLRHIGGPHSRDSVICFIPEDRFVFLGDSNGKDLYEADWKFEIEHEDRLIETLNAIPFDVPRLTAYRDALEKLDFTRCIGGHYIPLTKEELFETLTIR